MNLSEKIDKTISDDSLIETLSSLVNIASPTGEEAPLASHIASQLEEIGITAETQNLGGRQANALGKMGGIGSGRNLLLYAPIDTVTSNNEAEDIPWAAPEMRDDLRAFSAVKDGHVFGLGAHNPKGHAACIIETARVLKALNLDLPGQLFFGFGAGGMPTHSRSGIKPGSGHGAGCQHMLQSLPSIDGAIIAKSGTSVTWEEVGFIWLEVTVEGQHNYVGARHLMPYDNAIANAAKLVLELEPWFEKYADHHATDLVRPQGTISFMESGWKRMPAFTPAAARFRIDLRFGPSQTADDAEAEITKAIDDMIKELGFAAQIKRIQTIPASHTSPDSDIIKTAISIWEFLHGKPHEPFRIMSGSTDANIIRNFGIPTARIGLAKANMPDIDFALGMNCVSVDELRRLTRFLTMTSIEFLSEAA